MIAVALILGLVVVAVVITFYRNLANLRRQLVAARAQIDAQMAVRNELRAALQAELKSRSRPGSPAVVGVDANARLMDLRAAEKKIEFATQYYNQVAAAYSERLRVFPYSFIALSMRFQAHERLEFTMDQEIVGS
jgi:hypothetical protein